MLSMVDFGYGNCAAWLCFLNWLALHAGYAASADYSVWLGELVKLAWLFWLCRLSWPAAYHGFAGWLAIMHMMAGWIL
jgi:hypothetical protein